MKFTLRSRRTTRARSALDVGQLPVSPGQEGLRVLAQVPAGDREALEKAGAQFKGLVEAGQLHPGTQVERVIGRRGKEYLQVLVRLR